jgi:F-box protein 11
MVYASTATGLLTSAYQLKQRYRIVEKLGQGGFGAIYKVEDMLFNNATRAAKEMGMRGLNAQEVQSAIIAFRNEAQLLASLSHPNLPHIYDHFEEHGRWYLVMDYIAGETLARRLELAPDEKLPIPEVLDIGVQLCTVLGYLHSHQPPIIFRDLKPDNVMMTADNHLYLIDFGIARFFKPGQSKDTMSLGTPGYASPEQYGRMQTTIRSDIYSLGATLYHLVSGINPGLVPFLFQPLELDSQVPGNSDLEALIMQMLEMKEQKRPENTSVIKQELQRIQQLRLATQVKRVVAPPPVIVPLAPLAPVTPDLRRSIVVAQHGGGEYTTIGEAVKNAPPDTFILVQPGVYSESLVLDRDIEIVGSGAKEQIILASEESHCVIMQTDRATLRGLTLRCQAGQKSSQYNALAIPQGQLLVEDCAITSNASACIAIYNAATKPTIRYSSIHSGTSNGIVIYDNAQATIEYCDIFQHSQPAISITGGGTPTFRHCTIRDNQHYAIFVHNNGQGSFEDCDIFGNKNTALFITTQSNPLLLRCQLHGSSYYGVEVRQEGKGSLQECAIYENAYDNVLIATASTPYFYLCKIHDGQQSGVSITNNGKGTVEYCEIYAHRSANISIASGANPLISNCKIYRSQQSGIHIYHEGRGTITNCAITENMDGALDIAPGCKVVLKGNQL